MTEINWKEICIILNNNQFFDDELTNKNKSIQKFQLSFKKYCDEKKVNYRTFQNDICCAYNSLDDDDYMFYDVLSIEMDYRSPKRQKFYYLILSNYIKLNNLSPRNIANLLTNIIRKYDKNINNDIIESIIGNQKINGKKFQKLIKKNKNKNKNNYSKFVAIFNNKININNMNMNAIYKDIQKLLIKASDDRLSIAQSMKNYNDKWFKLNGNTFDIRPKDYYINPKKKGSKVASAPGIYDVFAIDSYKFEKEMFFNEIRNKYINIENEINKKESDILYLPQLVIINIMIPCKTQSIQVILYSKLSLSTRKILTLYKNNKLNELELPESISLFHTLINNKSKDIPFKITLKINNLSETSLGFLHKKIIKQYTGQSSSVNEYATYEMDIFYNNYFIININYHLIGNKTNKIWNSIQSKVSTMRINIGFHCGGKQINELPEQILLCTTINKLSIDQIPLINQMLIESKKKYTKKKKIKIKTKTKSAKNSEKSVGDYKLLFCDLLRNNDLNEFEKWCNQNEFDSDCIYYDLYDTNNDSNIFDYFKFKSKKIKDYNMIKKQIIYKYDNYNKNKLKNNKPKNKPFESEINSMTDNHYPSNNALSTSLLIKDTNKEHKCSWVDLLFCKCCRCCKK